MTLALIIMRFSENPAKWTCRCWSVVNWPLKMVITPSTINYWSWSNYFTSLSSRSMSHLFIAPTGLFLDPMLPWILSGVSWSMVSGTRSSILSSLPSRVIRSGFITKMIIIYMCRWLVWSLLKMNFNYQVILLLF